MHVLEILNSYPGETFLQEHAKALTTDSGIRLSWAFWQSGSPGPLPAVVPKLEHCIGLTNPNRIGRARKAMLRLRYLNQRDPYTQALTEQVRRLQPDIIHFQFASLALRHYQWVEALGIPYTFSVRGADIQSEVIASQQSVDQFKKMVAGAAGIHAVCDHLKEVLYALCGPNDKTTVIRTVINEHWKHVIRKPVQGHFVSIGRLHWRKNYSDLLAACSMLRKKGQDISLTLIGDGEQRLMLEYMIRDMDLSDCVKLTGRLDAIQIKAYLEAADAFVLPSIAEGFPNVAGEAAFAKIPLIVSEHSFASEVFESNEEIAVVPTGSAEKLAKSMETFLQWNTSEKTVMTERAYEKASVTFSSHTHATHFIDFWQLVTRENKE